MTETIDRGELEKEGCTSCSMYRLELRGIVKAARRAERAGRRPNLTRVDYVKAQIRECASRGHALGARR